jgi:hypothetical protein
VRKKNWKCNLEKIQQPPEFENPIFKRFKDLTRATPQKRKVGRSEKNHFKMQSSRDSTRRVG